MEHAMIWARAFRPSLEHVIDGQGFANMMHFIGAAVCAAHADSTAQNGFMRSKAGQEYQQALADNLALHKSRMAK